MKYTVQIANGQAVLEVEDNNTLLHAALASGIDYPHGCREGRCGSCKSRVISGDFSLLEHSRFALSAEEKAEGMVLACRALPRSNSVVRWIGSEDNITRPPVRTLELRVSTIDDVTSNVRILQLSGDTLDFLPGQYARLKVGDAPVRDYSMASQPGASEIVFHVRHIVGGATSSRIHADLAPGDMLTLEGPFGSAHLHETHTRPILCIGGGTGAAPLESIVEAALARGMRQPIHFYHGGRSSADLYVTEKFSSLARDNKNLFFSPVADVDPHDGERRGRVLSCFAKDITSLIGWKCYFAGPPALTEAACELALSLGASAEDIHSDPFFTPSDRW